MIAATGSVAWSPSTECTRSWETGPSCRRPKRLAPLDADQSVALRDTGSNPLGLAQGIEKQRS